MFHLPLMASGEAPCGLTSFISFPGTDLKIFPEKTQTQSDSQPLEEKTFTQQPSTIAVHDDDIATTTAAGRLKVCRQQRLTQVHVRQHLVQELGLHAVRRQEVCQQLTVTELRVLQKSLHVHTHKYKIKLKNATTVIMCPSGRPETCTNVTMIIISFGFVILNVFVLVLW